MGGGDDPDVGLDRLVAADPLELLLLQEPEDLALEHRRHVADLVEEEGPAVALLELADPGGDGPGEGALLVAEELRLEQPLGDRRAVDRQERALDPAAVLVDGAGDQFLAGPALAADQDGHVLRRDPADRLVDVEHLRAAADQQVALGPLGAGVGQHDRLVHQPADLDRLVDLLPELLDVQRLVDVVVGAELDRLDRRLARRDARDEDHRQLRVEVVDPPVEVQPRGLGQQDVEQDDVRVLLLDQGEPLVGRAGVDQVELQRLQGLPDQVLHGAVIIDHQGGRHGSDLEASGRSCPAVRRETRRSAGP